MKYDPKCLPALIGLGDYYSNYLGSYSKALKLYRKTKDLIKLEEQIIASSWEIGKQYKKKIKFDGMEALKN